MRPLFLGGLQVGPIRRGGDGTAGELESKSELQAGSSSSSSRERETKRMCVCVRRSHCYTSAKNMACPSLASQELAQLH